MPRHRQNVSTPLPSSSGDGMTSFAGNDQFIYVDSTRGGPAARGHCRLVIAPIGHGSMLELKYPENAGKLPRCADSLAWFDEILKGQDNGIARDKPVHYYVMGDPTTSTHRVTSGVPPMSGRRSRPRPRSICKPTDLCRQPGRRRGCPFVQV